jgi:hypothetical protein
MWRGNPCPGPRITRGGVPPHTLHLPPSPSAAASGAQVVGSSCVPPVLDVARRIAVSTARAPRTLRDSSCAASARAAPSRHRHPGSSRSSSEKKGISPPRRATGCPSLSGCGGRCSRAPRRPPAPPLVRERGGIPPSAPVQRRQGQKVGRRTRLDFVRTFKR